MSIRDENMKIIKTVLFNLQIGGEEWNFGEPQQNLREDSVLETASREAFHF